MFSQEEIAFSKEWIKTIYDLKKSLDLWALQNLQDLWENQFQSGYMQFLLLIDSNGQSNSELAKQSGISKQAMSKIIAKLDELGLVTVNTRAGDKRSSTIALSPKGASVVSESLHRFASLITDYRKEIGAQDLEVSRHTLHIAQKLIANSKLI